ncbi:MAG TPA: carbohydrate kinase [Pyrinomonadaceae bacterium]|jgi:fructokinase|nr:carbohydrate kinase [Pyrinomonadaceae bacterium]
MRREEQEPLAHAAFTVAGLGELIWDLLPTGRQLGGAPTNFAYISRLLGNRAVVASRVGADELGREALARLERLGISTSYLQQDPLHPTGTVGVEIDEHGEPRFAVNQNSAWDYLEWNESWDELAHQIDVVCFGTLGQRQPQARETIIRFLKATRARALRIFDVNLRHSFFTAEMLSRSLELASIVKLNREELSMATGMLGLDEHEDEAVSQRLLALFDIELVAITHGAQGSLLVTREETVNHPGFQIQVRDTIGAGDAFTAALAHYYLRRAPLKLISEAANRMGAWLATQAGATPEASPQLLEEMFSDLETPTK